MGGKPRTQIEVGKIYNRPQIVRNTLFKNRGDGTYAEIANYSGVQASDWTWSNIFMDVDLDGYEDLLVANGHAATWTWVPSAIKVYPGNSIRCSQQLSPLILA